MSFFRQFSPLVDDFKKGVKYAIIQNSLPYRRSNWPFAKERIVKGFRPPIQSASATVLFLTEDYKKVLLDFLGPDGPGAFPDEMRDEIWERRDFLNQFVSVYPYHWWQGWNLETPPYVSNIVFNLFRTKATVYYRVGYEGGEAVMERKGKGWILKKHRLTWME